MNLGGMNNSLIGSLNVFNPKALLRGKHDKNPAEDVSLETGSTTSAPVAQDLSIADGIKNTAITPPDQPDMMARNFVGADDKESRYLSATLASFSAMKKMRQSEQNTMTSILETFGGISGPSLYDPHGNTKSVGATEAEIKKILKMQAAKKIMEDAEEDMRDTKKRLEEKAQEAAAPKDANGNPIPDVTNAGSGPALAEVQAVPPAPAHETEPAAVDAYGGDAVPDISAPETALAPRPADHQISINITV